MSQGLPTDDEHLGSMTGAYALDALDTVERARLERHLARCQTCAAEVRSFRETAARLAAGAAVPAPARLRDSVLAEAARTRQLPPQSPSSTADRSRRPAAAWMAAAAAALLVVAGGLGAVAWRESVEARRARALTAAVSEVLTDPQRDLVTTEFADGRGVVLAAGDRVVVVGEQVTPPSADRVFQLWFIGEEGPRPSALLSAAGEERFWVEAEGLESGEAVAVTVEPAGGSAQPTSEPVLVATPAPG